MPNARAVGILLGLALACRVGSAAQFRKAVEACYEQRYDVSWKLILSLTSDSLDPEPAYWQASLVQMLCYETGDRAMVDSFHRMSDRVEALCRRRLERNSKDTLAYLYLGMGRLNRANSYAWEQKQTQAMRAMVSASTPLRSALALHPGLPDAEYGLGMIEYFRSLGDKYLMGLGILGSKQRAFRLVRKGVEGYGPFVPSARLSLAWMLGQEKRYDEAIAACRQLLCRYPGNRMLVRIMRDINLNKRDYEEVIRLGREMEESVLGAFPNNRYYLAENRLVMAKAHIRAGQPEKGRVLLEQVVAWERYQDRVPWLKNYVIEAKRLKRGMGS